MKQPTYYSIYLFSRYLAYNPLVLISPLAYLGNYSSPLVDALCICYHRFAIVHSNRGGCVTPSLPRAAPLRWAFLLLSCLPASLVSVHLSIRALISTHIPRCPVFLTMSGAEVIAVVACVAAGTNNPYRLPVEANVQQLSPPTMMAAES
jgi:hypothetical protein